MRAFYRALRILSAVTLFFFSWTFLPLWQIAAFAAEPQAQGAGSRRLQSAQGSGSTDPSQSPLGKGGSRGVGATTGERFEKALEAIRENVSRAGDKADKGEDDAKERGIIKIRKAEIEAADSEFRKEFAATEKKLKDAKLPKEILDRHYKFVKHYEDNLKELKTNLAGIEQGAKSKGYRESIKKAKAHLEKTRTPSKHVPLDPNKLPHRMVKGKERAPRLKKEEFERDFPPQRTHKTPRTAGLWDADERGLSRIFNSAFRTPHSAIQQRPILLASNAPASDMPFSLGIDSPLYRYATSPAELFSTSPSPLVSLSEPLMLAQANVDLPTAADLAETTEVQFTQDIRNLATQLNNSPVKIFEWVKNNIEFVPTYGSIQGADMCLQSRQCNDFDTSSLLIALLRTSNLPAKYVYGTIEVPIDKAMNWVGGFTDARAAANFIASGNVPVSTVISGGVVKSIRIEHVWVETYIPYGNYRGAIMDNSIKTWIPMDGSFKQYTYTNGFDITSVVPYDSNAYMSQVQSQNAIHYYQSRIQEYLDANMPDTSIVEVKGYRVITQEIYHFLPSTLPYKTITQGAKFSSIPSSISAAVAFKLMNPATGSSVSYAVSTSELAAKRITVSYLPATQDDEALIAQYGGFLYDVPAYMLNLKPVLRVEGVIKLTGETATLGSEQSLTMQFTQPNGNTESREKKLLAGAYYAVGLDLQGINENVLGKRNYQLNTNVLSETAGTLGTDDLIGEHLFILATTYFLANDKVQKSGAKLFNTAIARTISEGITSFTLTVSNIFGTPRSAMPSGINMDVAMAGVIVSARDGDTRKEMAYMDVHGSVGSYHEHDIFEKIDGFSSVSAIKALQTAAANNIPIKKINAANISQMIATLQVSSEIITDIQNAVNAGKEVTISQTNVQINDWNGAGYIIKDSNTGAGAYMISGGLAGSDSTNKQDGMQIVVMHKEPLGYVKDNIDPHSRNTIASVAIWESFEPGINEGEIQNAIVGGVNFCATYPGVGQCTGLVYKAYRAAGMYLFGASLQNEGGNYRNGLDIIWGINQDGTFQSNILHDLVNAQKVYNNAGVRNNDPLKGDIIFFKNTWIRNQYYGIEDQGITHVGIVMAGPDTNGKITFAQASVSKGVLSDSTLNIVDSTAYSTVIRVKPTSATASQLFAGFGTIRNILPTILLQPVH
jgi:transglutaminase-like putative cysteine protease